ncbi:MAG TPA: aspartate-semialdehyde dehydrogenase [Bdellovibrionota bacterium]|nr:aspartate-semialdehyde dehydrogenase [Bdellovibrionota bacterium]
MARSAAKSFVFSVVGATGVVGREMVSLLSSRKFPLKALRLAASERSQNQTVEFNGEEIAVRRLAPELFAGSDFVFFTAGAAVSREFVPVAARAGALVIDNTSAFRMDADVPLAVPEVNAHTLDQVPERRIVSVPNCAAIQMAVALGPLHEHALIRRIVVSTFQSTSGAGRRAMEELSRQVTDLFNYRETKNEVFPERIAFNLIPHIGDFAESGETGEEIKICEETKKILGDSSIGVSVTAVRVPTFHGHAVSINVETKKSVTPEEARAVLSKAKSIRLIDDRNSRRYPVLADAVGQDTVCVGRIRADSSRKNCLNLWVVADNLRKGAALNAIQIAEHFVAKELI